MLKLQKVILRNITCYDRRHLSAVATTKINKVLIANRGEIACRVIKTAKKLGIKSVAVYSDVDRDSMHVDLADEAYHIGPAASSQSYLRQDKIVAVAKKSKCQAIHPGYGFLSENAEFADFCQKENIIFIGPPAKAIRDMGVKSTSKIIMAKSGVPIVEGYHGEDQSNEKLQSEAKRIGFPVMIKAVMGGGGKGMRIVLKPEEFIESLNSARDESQKAYGDQNVLLEKYISEPRHVEVQIFADKHGNVVHLYERDCSVQRRHQKIIEEAPAPCLPEKLREELCAAAVRAAKAVGYVGAGTVEFILDKQEHTFHFMEMNTRLQVEHPVTEAITGTDLVEWQLRVAAGETLPMKQQDISSEGHAFEARIYAENPNDAFLPEAGRLLHLTTPEVSDSVRVETGVRQNDEVSVHYDPMIAKLVVWGNDRDEALNVLHGKLSDYNIVGLETNVDFIRTLSLHPKFREGKVHTGFIEENQLDLFEKTQIKSQTLAQGALAVILLEEFESLKSGMTDKKYLNPFVTEVGFRLNHSMTRRVEFVNNNEKFVIDIDFAEPEVYLMRVNDLGPWRKVSGTLRKNGNVTELKSEIDGIIERVRIVKMLGDVHIFDKYKKWSFSIPKPKYRSMKAPEIGVGAAVSPMPGIVGKILVQKGDSVKKGDSLLVVIAMKMELIIKALSDGVIEEILCSEGENVAKDKLLVTLKNNESE